MTAGPPPGAAARADPGPPQPPAEPPAEPDRRARHALLIAGTLPAAYALLILLTAALRLVSADSASQPRVTAFPSLLADMLSLAVDGLIAAALTWVVGAIILRVRRHKTGGPRAVRVSRIVMLAAFVLPYVLADAEYTFRYAPMLGTCLPATGLALWGFHRIQRYRRIPLPLLLAAFGWGLLIVPGYTDSVEFWSVVASLHGMPAIQSAAGAAQDGHLATMILLVSAAFFEEAAKLAGVAILFVLFGPRLDGIVSGTVLGAAAGLGLNLAESFANMGLAPGSAASQYWLRQCVGLMAAHTAFTAIAGAGVGLAQQARDPEARIRAVACGLGTAVCGHFASDAVMTAQQGWHIGGGQTLVTLVVLPALILVVEGPLVAMYGLLLRDGLRTQARGLAVALADEVNSGRGAITVTEATTLLNPRLRLWARATALRSGLAAWRELSRLQSAQMALAARRWHRSCGLPVERDTDGDGDLRSRISELRARQSIVLSSVAQTSTT